MVCGGVRDAQSMMDSRFQRVSPLLLKMKLTSCGVGPLEDLHLNREASGIGLGQARMLDDCIQRSELNRRWFCCLQKNVMAL